MAPRTKLSLFACLFVIALYFGATTRFIVRKLAKPMESAAAQKEPLTFAREIAPIIFDRCSECHRPGQVAPFSLTTYDEVRQHSRDIARVTASRYMPPWLPEPGIADMINQRFLTSQQIETIQRWIAEGMLEGKASDLPPLPRWRDGWQLGPPDLVVTLPEAYTLAPGGRDIYRNFAIPVAISGAHYVRAVEFNPGPSKVVHHAVVLVDRTPGSRQMDQRDEEPGFAVGMSIGTARPPDGHFIGWTPGKRPLSLPEGMAWALEEGMDLVLQLHMRPSGKPETVQPQIALHFSDTPPTRFSHPVVLRSKAIDIPPGERNYRVAVSYELPVNVDALGVYPHAHYLATEMKVKAVLPGGGEKRLMHIKQWDFNWQDEYRFVSPIFLPKGAVVAMEYLYDNSDQNIRNPNQPPQRVAYGQNSTDEMAELLLQVAPRSPEELEILKRETARQALKDEIEVNETRLRLGPADAQQHSRLGALYQRLGEPAKALEHFQEALGLGSRSAKAHFQLADVLAENGRFAEALQHFRQADALEPNRPEFLESLAQILARHPDPTARQPSEAIELAQRAVALTQRRRPSALEALAVAHAAGGEIDASIAAAEEGIRVARASRADELAEQMRQRLENYKRSLADPSRRSTAPVRSARQP